MIRERASIVAVTSEVPWPLDTGGHLRTFHLLRALAARFEVRLVVPALAGQEKAIAAVREQRIDVRPVPVGRRTWVREARRAALAAVRNEPYVLYGRHAHAEVRAAVRAEVGRAATDAVYCDHLDSLQYAVFASGRPVIIDLHNVYSVLTRRVAGEHRVPVRAYLRREAALLARMEQTAVRTAALTCAVSEEDAAHFRSLGAREVAVVPNGVDTAAYDRLPAGRRFGPPTIVYVGVLSWPPNAAAASFLATTVLPAVRAQIPDAELRIIGRGAPREILALRERPGVAFVGAVPDVVPELGAAHVLAVPLESGGGTRLKILEAFAAGVPVVSTRVGCEGIRAVPGVDLVVAERERFADAIVTVLRDADGAAGMATRARQVARDEYDWSRVGERLCAAVTRHVCAPTVSDASAVSRQTPLVSRA
jgi:glycosyltransferase involved in cell wall biosynthesis